MSVIEYSDKLLIIGTILTIIAMFGAILIFNFRGSLLKKVGFTVTAIGILAGISLLVVGLNTMPPSKASFERARIARELLVRQEVSLRERLDFYPPGISPTAFDSVIIELQLTKGDAERLRSVGRYRVRLDTNSAVFATNTVK